MTKEQQNWRSVKANIVLRFGTVRAAAENIGASPEAMRLAVKGKQCPGIRAKMIANQLLVIAAQ